MLINIHKVLETKNEQFIYEKVTYLTNEVTWIEKLP